MNLATRRNSSEKPAHDSTRRTENGADRAGQRRRLPRAGAEPIRRLSDLDRELDVAALTGGLADFDADEGGEGGHLAGVGSEFAAARVVDRTALGSIAELVPHADIARGRSRHDGFGDVRGPACWIHACRSYRQGFFVRGEIVGRDVFHAGCVWLVADT